MKTNNNDPAFGFAIPMDGIRIHETKIHYGLTKREYFAAMAMQGLLVNAEINSLRFDDYSVAIEAVKQADRLIEQLNEQI